MAIVLMALACVCGCAAEEREPEVNYEQDIAAIKKGVAEELDPLQCPSCEDLTAYLSVVDDGTLSKLQEYCGMDPCELLEHVLRRFSYTVDDVLINGDEATVMLTISSLNCSHAVEEAKTRMQTSEALEETARLYASESDEDYQGLLQYVIDVIYACLDESDELFTGKVELHLQRQGDSWVVDPESLELLFTAVTDGLTV